MATKAQTIERLVRKHGNIRVRDLTRQGLSSVYLGRLVQQGRLVRRARGVYAPARQEISRTHEWELACLRLPNGVLCLLSALVYHGIGTQNPAEVWMAIDVKAWRPRVDYPRMRIVRFSGPALSRGIMTVSAGRATLRVYDPAKTVADCFKYRNKIGLEVAVEALREGWRSKKFSLEQLAEAARICRVRKIIQPYLEMLA
ncbi:MAG: type IV toxin-antitoxin system AbiEi family antitoxin domain-containing protein [Verrucomicrobia bacterium]|nr:type IV toxin-antitoxin system AbiEi family antitoxin domain-containing protein [Verrucomicrobiota bacterium]